MGSLLPAGPARRTVALASSGPGCHSRAAVRRTASRERMESRAPGSGPPDSLEGTRRRVGRPRARRAPPPNERVGPNGRDGATREGGAGGGRAGSGEAVLGGDAGGGGARGDVELAVDRAQVGLDGVGADEEPLGDLAVGAGPAATSRSTSRSRGVRPNGVGGHRARRRSPAPAGGFDGHGASAMACSGGSARPASQAAANAASPRARPAAAARLRDLAPAGDRLVEARPWASRSAAAAAEQPRRRLRLARRPRRRSASPSRRRRGRAASRRRWRRVRLSRRTARSPARGRPAATATWPRWPSVAATPQRLPASRQSASAPPRAPRPRARVEVAALQRGEGQPGGEHGRRSRGDRRAPRASRAAPPRSTAPPRPRSPCRRATRLRERPPQDASREPLGARHGPAASAPEPLGPRVGRPGRSASSPAAPISGLGGAAWPATRRRRVASARSSHAAPSPQVAAMLPEPQQARRPAAGSSVPRLRASRPARAPPAGCRARPPAGRATAECPSGTARRRLGQRQEVGGVGAAHRRRASPLAASCSSPNSRIVSSIAERGSPPGPASGRSRLLSTSEAMPSNRREVGEAGEGPVVRSPSRHPDPTTPPPPPA